MAMAMAMTTTIATKMGLAFSRSNMRDYVVTVPSKKNMDEFD